MCPRCNAVIDYNKTYCDKHQKEYEERQKERHKEYKQKRQDKAEQAFYNSDDWIKTRDYVKGMYNGLCLYSYYVLNQVVFCEVVHHIVELKEDWDSRLDEKNLIPLSDSIHNRIHISYRSGKKKEVQKLLRELKVRWKKEMGETLLK